MRSDACTAAGRTIRLRALAGFLTKGSARLWFTALICVPLNAPQTCSASRPTSGQHAEPTQLLSALTFLIGRALAAEPPLQAPAATTLPAQSPPKPDVCEHDNAEDWATALKDWQPGPTEQRRLFYTYSRLPVDGPAQIAVAGVNVKADDGRKLSGRLHVLVMENPASARPPVAAISGLDISASGAERKPHSFVEDGKIAEGDLLLDFVVPWPSRALDLGWHAGRVIVFGCSEANELTFAAAMYTTLSDRWTCVAISAIVTLLLYGAVAYAACARDNGCRPHDDRKFGYRYLDPVMLASGPNGRGSISRLQILFFTVLLFFILLYLWLRVGLLSDMSDTVLLLLGISAVGAVAAKGADSAKRIDTLNWAWLVSRQWLTSFPIPFGRVARWKDLVTGDDGFDVYHFQMLIFSLVVGLALLQTGFTDLAHFDIPTALLGVLGLSQTVFVGGKLVAQQDIGELDKAVTDLRKFESDLASVTRDKQPLADSVLRLNQMILATQPPPVDLVASQAAAQKELDKADAVITKARDVFDKQMELVRTYFAGVLGPIPVAADFAPH